MIEVIKSHYKSISKFSVVGVVNTIIDFAVFSFLFYTFEIPFIIAHICAFCVAIINSFYFNAIWTFRNLKREQLMLQVTQFFIVGLVGLGFSTITLYFAAFFMPAILAKCVAMGVSLVWNYVASWVFVFKK